MLERSAPEMGVGVANVLVNVTRRDSAERPVRASARKRPVVVDVYGKRRNVSRNQRTISVEAVGGQSDDTVIGRIEGPVKGHVSEVGRAGNAVPAGQGGSGIPPEGRGKPSVRGGYGVAYDRNFGN